jgi:signal transduction histidine kinase
VFVRDERTRRLTRVYPASAAATVLADEDAQALDNLAVPTLTSELEVSSTRAGALFRAERWEVAIPLRINNRLTGLVALERNKDFRIFSGEDLQVLTEVAAGASVALENASLLPSASPLGDRARAREPARPRHARRRHRARDRNPLVAVKTFLDLLPQRLDDPAFLTQFRDRASASLRRVTDLIADLLALGKSKTPQRRAIDVAVVLEPVVRLMESTARKRNVEVAATFEPRLPAVWADPDQLKQIVLNLLLNAIDTSPAGSPVALDVRRALADSVVLEVRDEGAGIAPQQLETIFHPFFTTKETGTGLGLALVHQMVVEHGGEITVESTVGRGTVFRVTLPTQVDLARTGT